MEDPYNLYFTPGWPLGHRRGREAQASRLSRSAHNGAGKFILIGRVATLYYFVHFLVVLPLLSKFERPLPVPPSISEAVLKEAERRAVPAAGARETWLDTAVEV